MERLESESLFGMIKTVSSSTKNWTHEGLRALQLDGVFVLESAIPRDISETLARLAENALELVREEIGDSRLSAAGESGVVRVPLKFYTEFAFLLEVPDVVTIVERVISESAICHLMNAIVLEPRSGSEKPGLNGLFQSRLHRDFPRFLGGKPLSLNSFYCLTDFSPRNGSTRFLVGSHQKEGQTGSNQDQSPVSVHAPAGSAIIFDSTIWHSGGMNATSEARIGVNVQWTHHWMKQQIDLVRILGSSRRGDFSPAVQQRLGYNSQVVTSLQEYYVPTEQRIYRAGQG